MDEESRHYLRKHGYAAWQEWISAGRPEATDTTPESDAMFSPVPGDRDKEPSQHRRLSTHETARQMPSARGVPKVAVAWFGLVGSLLLLWAIVLGGTTVSDAPEDFMARGFRDLFWTAAVLGGVLNLVAAISAWRGWRWVGFLVALSGLVICALLLGAIGFLAVALVAGYILCIGSLLGKMPA